MELVLPPICLKWSWDNPINLLFIDSEMPFVHFSVKKICYKNKAIFGLGDLLTEKTIFKKIEIAVIAAIVMHNTFTCITKIVCTLKKHQRLKS